MNSKPTSELEWLYFHLWLKAGQSPPQFIFTLAEAVFYRQQNSQNTSITGDVNIPENWYFTSKDGYILKKNRLNVSTAEIQKAFTKRMEIHDQVAAIAYYSSKSEVVVEIDVQHMQPSDLKALLFNSSQSSSIQQSNDLPFAVQKFFTSKQIKNTVYRCTYSSTFLNPQAPPKIEKLQNGTSFFDLKVPIDERTGTFESNVENNLDQQDQSNVPQQLQDNIGRSIRQIRDHILINSKVDLTGGIFYFKLDRKDNLILFFVSNINVRAQNLSAHAACLGYSQAIKIYSRSKKQSESF